TQTTIAEGGAITTTTSSPVTAKEKIKKKNDVKARSMLLMALPNENLMTFNQYKDAKSLFAAIETRFGGNEATKKTQKTLLKQMYENFSATSTKSLPSEWNTHVVIWSNKPDLDTMSIDDLYNNFKIVKQEVKGTASSNSRSQNMAFVSSPSTNSTNDVYTAYGIGHFARECRGPRNQDSINRYRDSSRRTLNVEETPPKAMVAIDGVGCDWSYMAEDEVPKNMALMDFSDSESLNKLLGSQITNKRKNGLGFQSYNAVLHPATLVYNTGRCPPPKTDLSYSGLDEFKQPQFESYRPKSCKKESKNASEDISIELKEYPDAPLVKDSVSDNKDFSVESFVVVEKKTNVPTIAKVEFVRAKQQEKPVRKPVKLTAITVKGKGWNMAPRGVLMKTGLRPLNTARPVNTTHPKTTVNSVRPRPRAVNTARPNSTVVNDVRENQINVVKASGHPQKVQEDQGYVNSGCSRNMTKNTSYLFDFKEFDGGYVTFGGGANGGRITDEHVTITSHDPLVSDEDRLKLTELMELCTQLQLRVLVLETTKANQALKIGSLKRRGRNDQDMFDTSILDDEEVVANELDDEEVVAEKEVSTADLVFTAGKVVTTAGKTSKPKAKGIVIQEPSETPKTPTPTLIDSSQQPSKAKDKEKAKMIKPEKPLKMKDQIMIDEEVARNLKARMQAELEEEEERLSRQKEEKANIALIKSRDNTQALMDADYELVVRL
nr:ribonuclease H-like domain-containing protein [Tanacetum cinerariifolium]